ncbi:MAG: hypothetical protein M3Z83_07815 [Actinomycetota bacterium]|nr:hypothetical protein [Actinomycetota bacterium]
MDLVDRIRQAVTAVPGVADLHAGAHGEVATYGVGRRVNGVRIRDTEIQVHIVTRWGAPVLAVADAVRLAVLAVAGTPGTQVDIVVQDVAAPTDAAASPKGDTASSAMSTPRSTP